MHWINVEKRLPETNERFTGPDDKVSDLLLVYDAKEGEQIAFLEEYLGSYEWIALQKRESFVLEEVTHWMPLPELPK